MRLPRTWCAAALVLSCTTALANGDLIVKKSHHDVKTTVDRLETAVQEKGITVIARVNHAAAATSAGLSLRPTELLVFGNPKLGTPLMQSNGRIGLDLPLRVVAWQDAQGETWLAYHAPQALAHAHRIRDRDAVVKTMTGALNALTDRATRP